MKKHCEHCELFEQILFSKVELRNDHFNKPYTASSLCLILILIHTTPLHVGDLRHLLPTEKEREREVDREREREITGTVGGRL